MSETAVAPWTPQRLPAGWRCVAVHAWDDYDFYNGRLGRHRERSVRLELIHVSGIAADIEVNGIPDENWLIQYLTVLASMPLAVKRVDASDHRRRDLLEYG